MSLLDNINAMKVNVGKAEAIITQLTPLKAEFDEQIKSIEGLDKSLAYFGVNEDGTATLLDFDPTNGAPRFNSALPLPVDAALAEPTK